MILFVTILSILYAAMLIVFLLAWARMDDYSDLPQTEQSTRISVVIAVRNEEKNIEDLLQDLNAQEYPCEKFEVLVIDDFSSDRTAEIVKTFNPDYELRLLTLPEEYRDSSNKKRAIRTGIEHSTGDFIVTTDGDCRVGAKWLSAMEFAYTQKQMKMVAGPVTFIPSENRFKRLQILEFASLICVGASTLYLKRPTMCNGANLGYEKKAFYEVNGFEGNEHVASGDDEFLMHKIHAMYPGKVTFIKSREAIVTTEAKETIPEFFQQRQRWASKWGHYKNYTIRLLAFFIFLYNLAILGAAVLTVAGVFPGVILLEQLIVKISIEFVFLTRVLTFFDRKVQFSNFFILQLIHPFYVCFFALTSISGKYEWKGRKLKSLKIDRSGI